VVEGCLYCILIIVGSVEQKFASLSAQ